MADPAVDVPAKDLPEDLKWPAKEQPTHLQGASVWPAAGFGRGPFQSSRAPRPFPPLFIGSSPDRNDARCSRHRPRSELIFASASRSSLLRGRMVSPEFGEEPFYYIAPR